MKKLLKKIILPMFYVGEWVLFFYVILFILVFNMTYHANMILIDMPWEERITLPFIKALLFILGVGSICFIYFKYLIDKSAYIKFNQVIWGILFGANTLSCMIWLLLSYPFGLSNNERILLVTAILVCAILTVQVIIKFRNEKKD